MMIASKVEDINTTSMPVVLLFAAGFMVVILSMSSEGVDTTLMKVCSYIPFTLWKDTKDWRFDKNYLECLIILRIQIRKKNCRRM